MIVCFQLKKRRVALQSVQFDRSMLQYSPIPVASRRGDDLSSVGGQFVLCVRRKTCCFVKEVRFGVVRRRLLHPLGRDTKPVQKFSEDLCDKLRRFRGRDTQFGANRRCGIERDGIGQLRSIVKDRPSSGNSPYDWSLAQFAMIVRSFLPLIETEGDGPGLPSIQTPIQRLRRCGCLRKHPFVEAHIETGIGAMMLENTRRHRHKKSAARAPGKSRKRKT